MATRTSEQKRQQMLALYNAVPNFFWSIIGLTPISVYCWKYFSWQRLVVFLVLSLVPVFFSRALMDKLQIGRTVRLYKKLGVHRINAVAQNGVMVNRLMRRQFGDHKIVSYRHSSISAIIGQTYMFEKFHLVLFVFFVLTMTHAFVHGRWGWTVVIFLTNVLYNVYPNLLQQYVRVRLRGRSSFK
jgi:Glycosyl-4,4'-diaponeurosporenoate acyltransferase